MAKLATLKPAKTKRQFPYSKAKTRGIALTTKVPKKKELPKQYM